MLWDSDAGTLWDLDTGTGTSGYTTLRLRIRALRLEILGSGTRDTCFGTWDGDALGLGIREALGLGIRGRFKT